MDDNDDDFYDGPDESENDSYDSNGIAIYMHILLHVMMMKSVIFKCL